MMRAPDFWTEDGVTAKLLQPLGFLYGQAGIARRGAAKPAQCAVPVICVGNLVAGGAGKTPVAMALAKMAVALGETPHLLSRGYGGGIAGPVQVDPGRHIHTQVGDEPLLLAHAAPAWISRNRAAGAAMAARAGASLILLDDGLQNPSLRHDLSLLVVDGGYGFGNGRVMPAGPLRERLETALPRLGAAIVLGEDVRGVAAKLEGRVPLLRGWLEPGAAAEKFRGERVVAFAGIGRPEKFFATLRACGAEIVASEAFADHHPYQAAEIQRLRKLAARENAYLVTTEKDWVRLPQTLRTNIGTLPVTLNWDEASAQAMRELLAATIAKARP